MNTLLSSPAAMRVLLLLSQPSLAALTQCNVLSLPWLCTAVRNLPRTFASFYLLPPPHSFLNDSFLCAVPAPLVVTPRREGLQRLCFAPSEFQCLSLVSLLG